MDESIITITTENNIMDDLDSLFDENPPPPVSVTPFPDSETDPELSEELKLADQINRLGLKEGDQVLFDIHGLPQVCDEDPDNLEECLVKLEERLSSIPNDSKKKQAYNQAKEHNPDYVRRRDFLLLFLRSERFDIKNAAEKIVYHFEVKRALFGEDSVGKDIQLNDLSEDDKQSLYSGFMQVLPERDAAGRSVLWFRPMPNAHKSPENLLRSMWYIMSNVIKDTESQKKGIVLVLYQVGCKEQSEFAMLKQIRWGRDALPRKLVGVHFCYDNTKLRPYAAAMQFYLMSEKLLARYRPHKGTHEGVIFDLQTYGIPITTNGIDESGSLPIEWHHEWLELRAKQEERLSSKPSEDATEEGVTDQDDIVVPGRFDVLFGRGKTAREHTGNMRCLHLVEMHRQQYEAANKYEKTEIAERIVSQIHTSLGRFLKFDKENGWEEVDSDAAREKVSHYFRALRAKSPTHSSATSDSETVAPSKRTVGDDKEISISKQKRNV